MNSIDKKQMAIYRLVSRNIEMEEQLERLQDQLQAERKRRSSPDNQGDTIASLEPIIKSMYTAVKNRIGGGDEREPTTAVSQLAFVHKHLQYILNDAKVHELSPTMHRKQSQRNQQGGLKGPLIVSIGSQQDNFQMLEGIEPAEATKTLSVQEPKEEWKRQSANLKEIIRSLEAKLAQRESELDEIKSHYERVNKSSIDYLSSIRTLEQECQATRREKAALAQSERMQSDNLYTIERQKKKYEQQVKELLDYISVLEAKPGASQLNAHNHTVKMAVKQTVQRFQRDFMQTIQRLKHSKDMKERGAAEKELANLLGDLHKHISEQLRALKCLNG